ncbi:MAG: oligosaccharide flippase family protein [Clostridia bacterium]|nr:oligosaccharide flippase family protein [Clostridia bacterium]
MNNSLIKATLTISGLSILTRALSFGFRIYLSNALGAENLGVYQISLSVFFLFATLSAGLPLVTSRKTATALALGKNNESSFLSASLLIGLSLSATLCTLFYLLPELFSPLFSDVRCTPIFTLLLPSCLSTTVYGIIRGWFWGRKNYSLFAITEFVECVIRIALGLLLINGIIFSIDGVHATALSFTISDYVCTGILVLLFFSFGGKLAKPQGFREITKTALPLTAVRIYNSLVNSLIAIIVPAMLIKYGFDKSVAVADYGRAMGMAIPLLLTPSTLTGSLATVLVPELATLKAKNNHYELKQKINASLVFCILCSSLFVALFLPLGKEIGVFLYNDESAGTFVSISAFIMLPMSINGITTTILDSLGLEMKTMKNYVIGSAFLIAVLFLFPSLIGTYAISLGLGLSYVVTGGLNILELRKIGITVKAPLKMIISETITIGVVAFGATFIKNLLFGLPIIIKIIIPAVFITIFYALTNSLYGYVNLSAFYEKFVKRKIKNSP